MARGERKFRVVRTRTGKWVITGYFRRKWWTSKWEGRLPFYTQEMAQDYANLVNEDYYQSQTTGKVFDPHRWFGVRSFVEYLKEVYEIRQAGFNGSTRRHWQHTIRLLEASTLMASVRLKSIDYAHMEAFVLSLTDTGTNLGTALSHMKPIRGALKHAHKRGLIEVVPAIPGRADFRDHVKAGRVRDTRKPKRVLNPSQQAHIIAHLRPQDRPIVRG